MLLSLSGGGTRQSSTTSVGHAGSNSQFSHGLLALLYLNCCTTVVYLLHSVKNEKSNSYHRRFLSCICKAQSRLLQAASTRKCAAKKSNQHIPISNPLDLTSITPSELSHLCKDYMTFHPAVQRGDCSFPVLHLSQKHRTQKQHIAGSDGSESSSHRGIPREHWK